VTTYKDNPFSFAIGFEKVASAVASMHVNAANGGEIQISQLDIEPITIDLPLTDLRPLKDHESFRCAYWSSSQKRWDFLNWQGTLALDPKSSSEECKGPVCRCRSSHLSTFTILREQVTIAPSPATSGGDGPSFSEWWAFVTAFFVVILVAGVFCCLWRHAGGLLGRGQPEVEMQAAEPVTQEELVRTHQALQLRISRLFTFTYVEGSLEKEDAICSVCLTGFEGGESLRMLPCLHRFHKECVDMWLTRKPFCPLCKANPFRMQQPPRRVMRAVAHLPAPHDHLHSVAEEAAGPESAGQSSTNVDGNSTEANREQRTVTENAQAGLASAMATATDAVGGAVSGVGDALMAFPPLVGMGGRNETTEAEAEGEALEVAEPLGGPGINPDDVNLEVGSNSSTGSGRGMGGIAGRRSSSDIEAETDTWSNPLRVEDSIEYVDGYLDDDLRFLEDAIMGESTLIHIDATHTINEDVSDLEIRDEADHEVDHEADQDDSVVDK